LNVKHTFLIAYSKPKYFYSNFNTHKLYFERVVQELYYIRINKDNHCEMEQGNLEGCRAIQQDVK